MFHVGNTEATDTFREPIVFRDLKGEVECDNSRIGILSTWVTYRYSGDVTDHFADRLPPQIPSICVEESGNFAINIIAPRTPTNAAQCLHWEH